MTSQVSRANSGSLKLNGYRRSPRVAILGVPRLVAEQAARLSQKGWTSNPMLTNYALSVPFTDVVYQVGGAVIPSYLFRGCKVFGRPLVKHWIGTDVLRAKEETVRRQATAPFVRNWAVAPWLETELGLAGIDAKYVPLGCVDPIDMSPFPSLPLSVVVYMPGNKFPFYGGRTVLFLAKAFPDIQFLVVGNDGVPDSYPANVIFMGYQDSMGRIYARSHVLLRMTHHDGLSQMILEALNYARHAIWTHEFVGVHQASDEQQAASHLGAMRAKLNAGILEHNLVGMEYVRKTFSSYSTIDRVSRELMATIAGSASSAVQA